ncbi:MAG: DNA polymerase I [Simkaniaceae bacterium]
MDNLYLLDAVNYLFRSYYAIGPMTNQKGESTNALYGFIRSVQKVIKEYSPTHLACIFDGPENKQYRTKIYGEYKAHRKEMPEDLYEQLEKALLFCELANIPYLSVAGVEADDTIASIAKWAENKKTNVFLCSSDKDLCQLVDERIKIINIHKNLLIDKDKVKELYGIWPEQMVDYLALVGDKSDNIPGVPGFGPKTAAELLEQFSTLENLLSHIDQIASSRRQNILREHKEDAMLSQKLVQLHFNVDFPKQDSFFELKPPQLEKLTQFYHDMNFSTLLRELKPTEAIPIKEKPKAETISTSYKIIDNETDLKNLLKELAKENVICIDTETSELNPMAATLVGIGLSRKIGEAYYIPTNGALDFDLVIELLKPFLENKKLHFFGHNIKYDIHVFLNHGIQMQNICFDTMLASYLLNPQKNRHNLDILTLEEFNKVKTPIKDLIGSGKKQKSMFDVPLKQIADYCCEDVDYTYRLKEVFEKQLKKRKLNELLETIELPLIPVLVAMERNGMFIDTEKLKLMSHDLNKQIKELEKEIHDLAGEKFNINSPKQLSQILFTKMGLKTKKRGKKTGAMSTGAEVLEAMQEEYPIAGKILEYRALEKLRSTYVETLPKQLYVKTNRIHCTFNQSVAATGRLSCQDPNLQNIPIRSPIGKKIRRAFKPEKRGWSYLSADYSQIELRILAHLSEDPKLIRAFKNNEDIHRFTASQIFDVPLEEVTSEMRYRAKAVNFGLIYGQGVYGLAGQLGVSGKKAKEFMDLYFARYPSVQDFLESLKEKARKEHMAYTITGRQRPIPEILSNNAMVRAAAERLAINTPFQGSGADIIKMAMIEIHDKLLQKPHLGQMILQIHDELLFEVPDQYTNELQGLVKKTMESVFPLKVPLIVDIGIGKNWEEC